MDMMDYDYPDDEQYDAPRRSGASGSLLSSVFGNITAKPLNLAIAAFVVGVIFGWLVIGWGLWPVEWTDASPLHLGDRYQTEYVYMVVDSYVKNRNLELAQQRLSTLEGKEVPILKAMTENPGSDPVTNDAVEMFYQAYSTGGIADQPSEGEGEPAGDGEAQTSNTGTVLLVSCAVVLVLAAALIGVYFLKSRGRQPTGMTAAMRAQEYTRQAQQTDYEAMGKDAPIAQWMTTYLLGDDLFDDSFSIDSPSGEFLGECGVGIADTIGVGEPKRVSAFEVWLFDKNDIQTVTKVLMSGHTYNDEGSHNRLAAKGEPSLALPNTEVILETKTLRMVGRVMDMDYGTGHLPENSFFQRITLELAIWPK
jgi:hypothetical protein